MTAEIIVIGDELLIGQVTDTNSGMIARYLNQIGINIGRTTAVHDDAQAITAALDEAFARTNLVLMTGGLGPTKDDITKHTLCRYFHTRLVPSKEVEHHVRNLYKDRPEVLNRLTETQWLVPETCTVLENRVGSAPLMMFTKEGSAETTAADSRQLLFSMPGVPFEAEVAMKEQIIPKIKELLPQGEIIHKTIGVYGIPESSLAIRIAAWEEALPSYMHLAYLPANRMIRLRLTGQMENNSHGALDKEMQQQIAALLPLIKEYVVALEDKPIEVLVGQRLKREGRTIASAESCTGGKIAALLNKHAGSSAFYMGSVVAYDNSVKQNVLGVLPETLATYGAVSEQTVIEMANGVKKLLHTDYAVATSGIAGPDGGTKEKPVGTVWMAVATPNGVQTKCHHFRGGREQITDCAATAALLMLLASC